MLGGKNIFRGLVPESPISGRNRHRDSARVSSTEVGAARGQLRLRVLCSLPSTHQIFLFEKIKTMCSLFLRNNRVSHSEVSAEELLSEIWAKLIGTAVLPDEESTSDVLEQSAFTNSDNPSDDGRVVWLIEEIGGSAAFAHRYSDVERRKFGRTRRTRQLDDEDENITDPNGNNERDADATDIQLVWRGFIIAAAQQFAYSDDVSRLLKLMTDEPHLFDHSMGERWPVKQIVVALTRQSSDQAWNDRRLENAKRRLMRWVQRLMQENRLDPIDMRAMFARIARRYDDDRKDDSSLQPKVLS
jgi:hypothetical protein